MAKYRLRIAHEMETNDGQRIWLPGDVTSHDPSGEDAKGTLVGDGTNYKVRWPTLEMIPLDEEAEAAIALEMDRLEIEQASMNPIEDLAGSEYESRYIPGSGRQRRPSAPDGSTTVKRA